MQTSIARGPWPLLQAVAVIAAVADLALLLLVPDTGLFITWYVLIPLVPALLLVAPGLWRNLCPIAVLSQVPQSIGMSVRRRFPLRSRWGSTIGAGVLFLAIVPLRPAIFNQDGLALVVFVVSVLVVAIVGGVIYSGKGGWCSSLCPVLPVERLYGQLPIVEVEHAHCSTCDACVSGCYDLRPFASLHGLTRPQREEPRRAWDLLRTPLGVFAAGFPGFILGYFLIPTDSEIAFVYLIVVAASSASIVLLGAADHFLLRNRSLMLRLVAALAAAIYYWFTIPAIAQAADRLAGLGEAPEWAISATRLALLGLVAVWLVLAMRNVSPTEELDAGLSAAFD